jgi:PIN domain nuclease of toxin-antitoxin system
MIILDTHIWIWWAEESPHLTTRQHGLLHHHQSAGLGVSVLSCWEVAKLVSLQRLQLDLTVDQWLRLALVRPEVLLIDFTPSIAVEANRLPGTFHRDPVDQIIVATARVLDCPLLTADSKILVYPHVQLLT